MASKPVVMVISGGHARIGEAPAFEVTECSDPAWVVDTVHREAPDVIVVDLALEGLRGVEVVTELRKTHLHDIVEVIALAPEPSLGWRAELFREGLADVIDAKTPNEVIVQRIQEVLDGSHWDPAAEQSSNGGGDATEQLLALERERASGQIRLNRGEARGEIQLEAGRVTRARVADREGEEALNAVLRADDWVAEFTGSVPSSPVPEVVRPRALVVDDDEAIRRMFALYLSRHMEVVTAANGRDAVDKLRDNRPDIILSDVMMPGGDGWWLLTAVRHDYELRDIPVILLTNKGLHTHPLQEVGLKPTFLRDKMVRLEELLAVTLEALAPRQQLLETLGDNKTQVVHGELRNLSAASVLRAIQSTSSSGALMLSAPGGRATVIEILDDQLLSIGASGGEWSSGKEALAAVVVHDWDRFRFKHSRPLAQSEPLGQLGTLIQEASELGRSIYDHVREHGLDDDGGVRHEPERAQDFSARAGRALTPVVQALVRGQNPAEIVTSTGIAREVLDELLFQMLAAGVFRLDSVGRAMATASPHGVHAESAMAAPEEASAWPSRVATLERELSDARATAMRLQQEAAAARRERDDALAAAWDARLARDSLEQTASELRRREASLHAALQSGSVLASEDSAADDDRRRKLERMEEQLADLGRDLLRKRGELEVRATELETRHQRLQKAAASSSEREAALLQQQTDMRARIGSLSKREKHLAAREEVFSENRATEEERAAVVRTLAEAEVELANLRKHKSDDQETTARILSELKKVRAAVAQAANEATRSRRAATRALEHRRKTGQTTTSLAPEKKREPAIAATAAAPPPPSPSSPPVPPAPRLPSSPAPDPTVAAPSDGSWLDNVVPSSSDPKPEAPLAPGNDLFDTSSPVSPPAAPASVLVESAPVDIPAADAHRPRRAGLIAGLLLGLMVVLGGIMALAFYGGSDNGAHGTSAKETDETLRADNRENPLTGGAVPVSPSDARPRETLPAKDGGVAHDELLGAETPEPAITDAGADASGVIEEAKEKPAKRPLKKVTRKPSKKTPGKGTKKPAKRPATKSASHSTGAARALLNEGNRRLLLGDEKGAIKVLTKARKADPTSAGTCRSLALAFSAVAAKRKATEALACYRKLAPRAPDLKAVTDKVSAIGD